MMREFKTSDFDYVLPPQLIAQYPVTPRSASRLLMVNVATQTMEHHRFTHITNLLTPNDLLVFNNTKVIPARLFGKKITGGMVECLIERVLSLQEALAHIKANKSLKPGAEIIFAEEVRAVVKSRQQHLFQLEFLTKESVMQILHRYGHIPLPPYIHRADEPVDVNRYQTVFAALEGAVAAPTAGLHFDEELLATLARQKIKSAFVTLHVGAGTFQPVRTEQLHEHQMHHEMIEISPQVCEEIIHCKSRGGRVVAVGTTVVRVLETAAQHGLIQPFSGLTNIFIRPGYQFRCVDALITNFHLPKSTLLMLICALGGYELMMQAYEEAVLNQYRFYSYGDAMWIGSS